MSEVTSATTAPEKVPVGKIAAPAGPAELPFTPAKMVRWLAPGQLAVTAVRAVLSAAFGEYADRRETLAALHQHDADEAGPDTADGRIFTYDAHVETDGDFWLDFVADLGDGFDPTYTVAWLLGRPELPAPTFGEEAVRADGAIDGERTRRGHVLVMGGDQVYPTASRDEYANRLAGPYEAALPWVTDADPPHLFAIPGNHDWYDGLTSFIRQFCQRRWIGAWRTRQSRSYWALRLPHRWWVFGVDVQLQSDIDRPQIEYFCQVARELREGDRVILCTPEPAWAHTRSDVDAFDNLAYFEKTVIAPTGAQLALTLTGDLHHYARYSTGGESGTARHKITAGGGGAYLLGTQLLPETLDLETPADTKESWQRGPLYPDLKASTGIKWGAIFSFWHNPSFAIFLGAMYALFAWFLQSASKTSAYIQTSFIEEVHQDGVRWMDVAASFWNVAKYSPAVIAFSLLFVTGMIAFTTPDVERSKLLLRYEKLRTAVKVGVGGVHGFAHLGLAVGLTWLLSQPLANVNSLGNALLFIVGMVGLGGILGSLLLSLFLLPALNYNEAFSAQHLETYKNFVRLKIAKTGELHLWSYGVDGPGKWKFHPSAPAGTPYFDAVHEPKVRVIDRLTIDRPPSDGKQPEASVAA
ncbi:MAG TPA: hypothetical protein VF092_18175 [Longimicrobium sp.]